MCAEDYTKFLDTQKSPHENQWLKQTTPQVTTSHQSIFLDGNSIADKKDTNTF